MLVAIAGSLACFVAITSVLAWAAGSRGGSAETRLTKLGPQAQPGTVGRDAPFNERVVLPLTNGFARLVEELLPHSLVSRVGVQLVAAGRPMTTTAFFTIVTMTAVLFPGGAFLLILLLTSGSVP